MSDTTTQQSTGSAGSGDPTVSAFASEKSADLDALLTDFEREVPTPRVEPSAARLRDQAPSAPEQQQQARQSLLDDLKPSITLPKPPTPEQLDRINDQTWKGEVERWATGIEAERRAQRDAEDAAAIIAEANNAVSEYEHLPPQFAELWMRNAYILDAGLRDAIDNRYASPQHTEAARLAVGRALKQLTKAAAAEAARIAALPMDADRHMVAQAVRGASTKPPPPPKPNYNNMSDAEFTSDVEKKYGFRPRV